jgi:hypothetical protein
VYRSVLETGTAEPADGQCLLVWSRSTCAKPDQCELLSEGGRFRYN